MFPTLLFAEKVKLLRLPNSRLSKYRQSLPGDPLAGAPRVTHLGNAPFAPWERMNAA